MASAGIHHLSMASTKTIQYDDYTTRKQLILEHTAL